MRLDFERREPKARGPRLFPQVAWDAEKELKLRRLLATGNTFSQVALHFNTTRSAIAGKAKRLGLSKPTPRRT